MFCDYLLKILSRIGYHYLEGKILTKEKRSKVFYFCKYGYDGVSSIKSIREWTELRIIDDEEI